MMTPERKQLLLETYKSTLLEDVLPFWTTHGVDEEHGGFLTALDRNGQVLDTDKGMWQQGRATWLFGHLYNTVERRDSWLALAEQGINFIRQHGFDADGRMFFQVTRDGKPLRKRRYVYTEAFAAMAFATYARAANDDEAAAEASRLFRLFDRYHTTAGLMPPKVNPVTRPSIGIGPFMIAINLAQTLRDAIDDPMCNPIIDRSIEAIQTYFMKPELEAVMETVAPDGAIIDHFDGRTLNPGHALEAAWFILHEATVRGNDAALVETGRRILEWMWPRGWDDEYGGILYFRDLHDLPLQEYWHDMKFWWPHNEAIIATLLAHHVTGAEHFARWHTKVHDWSFSHFPDPEYGEWFGYLHRDGRLSVSLKGNLWKGPFHLPRMLLYCWTLLDR